MIRKLDDWRPHRARPARPATRLHPERARLAGEAGDMIFEPGDPADAIFTALPRDADPACPRGIVELSLPTSDGGNRLHLEHIVAGDVFGEFEFVAGGLAGGKTIRRSSARIVVPCHLYRVPFALLAAVLAEDEAVRTRLIKLSFDRLMAALNVTSAHLVGDRDVAFANWLIDAAENLGIAEGRHVSFSRPIGQREIAEALGVSRETMSLRLNEWERAGLLNTGGQTQRLEILDYPRVALRAGVQKDSPEAAIAAALVEVDADLARGDLVRARNIGLDMLAMFPSSPELRHRVALANIRAGNVREALAGLAYGGSATGGDVALLRERVVRGAAPPAPPPGPRVFGAGGWGVAAALAAAGGAAPRIRRPRRTAWSSAPADWKTPPTSTTRRSMDRGCTSWSKTSPPSRRARRRSSPSPPRAKPG